MSYIKKTWASGDTITSAALNNMENGIEAASQGGFIEVASLPLTDINTSSVYKLITPDAPGYSHTEYIGSTLYQESTFKSSATFESVMYALYSLLQEKSITLADESDLYPLVYFCCPWDISINGITLKIGYDTSLSKYVIKFTEFELDKTFDTLEEFNSYYQSDEFQTIISEFGGSDDYYNLYLASGKLNFKATASRDETSSLNIIMTPVTISYPNTYYIYDKEKWIPVENKFSSSAESSSILIKNGDSWKEQTGYGYDVDSIYLSWDGETEGKETMEFGDLTLYKVGDAIDKNVFINGESKLNAGSSENRIKITIGSAASTYPFSYTDYSTYGVNAIECSFSSSIDAAIISCSENKSLTIEGETIEFKQGLWFSKYTNTTTSTTTYISLLEFDGRIPMDSTLIPDLGFMSNPMLNYGDIIYEGYSKPTNLVPGTSGQFLMTRGINNSPIWSDVVPATMKKYSVNGTTEDGTIKFVKCTQTQYDALTTKDANTFYMIIEETE